jgi:iron-sulfur cluster repair protein YtfE (RIC family)
LRAGGPADCGSAGTPFAITSIAMNPAEARSELVRQHDDLRARLAAALALAARWAAGAPVLAELRRVLIGLRAAFIHHRNAEEALLEPLLCQDPTWGPRRIAALAEKEVEEHDRLITLLAGADAEVAADLAEIAEALESHMLAEESVLLASAGRPAAAAPAQARLPRS